MQKSISTCLLALSAQAAFQKLQSVYDGYYYDTFFEGTDWSTMTTMDEGWGVTLPGNSMLVLQNQEWSGFDYSFKPNLRGGFMRYWVYLDNMQSGCVAGVYLVATNAACDVEQQMTEGDQQCPSVEVMQTNDYGFELSTHPCASGNCDATSMCQYKMREQGAELYGADAWGPGGTLIDTYNWFQVQTDFVSENDYQNLWKVRTTIMQGDNTIVLEAECPDYLEPLDYDIQGQMAVVVSNWDNNDKRSDFEKSGGSNASGDCTDAAWTFWGLEVYSYGYNEERPDPEPTPEPEPEPHEFQGFVAYVENWGGNYEFYVKGLEGQYLQTQDTMIEIGENNRAFINDVAYDDDTWWSYKHDSYLGGTLAFDVNVADVPCQCGAGVFLAYINNEECTWNAHAVDRPPQCDTMAIMESNIVGFLTNHRECSAGTCTEPRQCQSVTSNLDGTYGPSPNYTINTMESYSVETQFYVDQDLNGEFVALDRVVTTLKQGENTVQLENSCAGIFENLYQRLKKNEMSIAVSSYNLGSHSDVATTCLGECTVSKAKISNISWTQDTSLNPAPEPEPEPEDEYMEAPSEFLFDCYDGCTQCIKTWWSNSPQEVIFKCIDEVAYRYGNQCKETHDRSRCSTAEMDYCFKAYPADSDLRWKDPANECRTVRMFNRDDSFKWSFGKKDKSNINAGLCILTSDPNRRCAHSWDPNEPRKNKGWTAMARVRPPQA